MPLEVEGAEEIRIGMRVCPATPPPPQSVPVRGRLCKFVGGWKRIKDDSYVLSIIAKGYRIRFTSPPVLLKTPQEIRSPQGPQKIQKNMITFRRYLRIPQDFVPAFFSGTKQLNAYIYTPHFKCILYTQC